jgi:SpoIID/LytB domain protein
LSKLNQKLIEAGLIPNANPVRTLTVPDALRYPSGRARAVRLALRDGAIFDLDALELRKALQLRSTMFSIEGNSKQVGFDGRGYGHGVGMSQDGARALSLSKKWTASQILHFYYTGVQICDASRRLTDCISGF